MPIALMTRVDRYENFYSPETLFDHHDALFERKLAVSAADLPFSARENILWDDNKSLVVIAKILHGLSENSKVTLDGRTDIDSKDVLPALKGVKSACRAIDDIAAGKKQHAVCASKALINSDHHEGQDLAFSVFSNAAIAAHYALTKPSLKRIALIDFEVNHGASAKKLIENNPNIMLMTAKIGGFKTPEEPEENLDSEAQDMQDMGALPTHADHTGHVVDVALPAIIHPHDLAELIHSKIIKPVADFGADLLILTLQPHNFEANWPNELTPESVNKICWDAAQKFTKGQFICILEGIENEDIIAGFVPE